MINALDTGDHTKFFCPDCGERLIRKVGRIKIPHFAHNRNTDCHGLSEGETLEHIQLKRLFQEWGNRFEEGWRMEVPLGDLSQRPDLLNNQLAVEIQCSSLPSTRLEERMTGYRQKNYQDWWLLGEKLQPEGKLTHLQRQFCSFDQEKGVHLWLIEKAKIRLLYHIHAGENLIYCEESWAAFSCPPKKIFYSKVSQSPPHLYLTTESIHDRKQALSLKLFQKTIKIRELQEYLYHERRHILYLPDWIYFPSRYYLFYEEDILLFRYLFQKEAKNASQIFEKFLAFRKESQRDWLFHRIDEREILERLYLEAIFCQRKAKVFPR